MSIGTYSEAPTKLSEVQAALDLLNNELSRLSETVGKIEDRLEKILSHQPPDNLNNTSENPIVQKCPLADTIENFAATAKGLRNRLETILQRIEL